MPIARFEMPDGRVARFEVPEGTTPEQAQTLMQAHFKPKVAPIKDLPKYNPTDGMSTTDRVLAGVGKAIVDTGRGIGGLVGLVSDADIAESRKLDKALMDTSGGFWGNIGGNVGMALLPGGALKGAGVAAKGLIGVRALSALPKVKQALTTAAPALSKAGGAILAPKSISAALGVGAGMGAIQPAEGLGERAINAGIGSLAGALVPAGVRVYQTGRSLMEPFTQKGREKIVGRAIQAAAGNDAPKLTKTIREASQPFTGPMPAGYAVPQTMGEVVPGSVPTVGQLAQRTQTPSIAAMERAATQTDPIVMNAAKVRLDDQNEARRQLLASMAGKQGQRQSAEAARTEASADLYRQATGANYTVDNQLQDLLGRPAVKQAMDRAKTLAENQGRPFSFDVQPFRVSAGAPVASSSKQITGQGLQDVKMAMDEMLTDPTSGFTGSAGKTVKDLRGQLLGWMEQANPDFKAARTTYAGLSKPLNQMDVADELLEKSTSSLDGRFYPNKFANALSDDTASRATGFKGATLDNTMSDFQMGALNGLKEDLQTQAFAAGAGKAGSDTVQKLAYSNMINQAGVPNWMRNFGGSQLVGGLVGRTGDLAYANANKQLSGLLGETLMDPQMTLKMLTLAQENDEVLRRLARSGSALGLMAPGLLNGGQ